MPFRYKEQLPSLWLEVLTPTIELGVVNRVAVNESNAFPRFDLLAAELKTTLRGMGLRTRAHPATELSSKYGIISLVEPITRASLLLLVCCGNFTDAK